jgi:hypothetical protein
MVTQSISRITNLLTVRPQLFPVRIAESPDEDQRHDRIDLARAAERYGAGIKNAKLYANHAKWLIGGQGHGRSGRFVPLS